MVETRFSKTVLRFGSKRFALHQSELRAGPVSLVLQDADLRHLRIGNTEVIQRLYMALRDKNWDTIPAVYSNWRINAREDSFNVSFLARHRVGEIDFSWRGSILGTKKGVVRYSMDGVAGSEFYRSRIGLCVLYPIGQYAGKRVRVSRTGRPTVQATFPTYVSPLQPLPGFERMRGMDFAIDRGKVVKVDFEGETFEMEDQRNWTDCSYKVYSTPLLQSVPVLIRKGEEISQSVTIHLNGKEMIEHQTPRSNVVKIRITGRSRRPFPRIGLCYAGHALPITGTQLKQLRAMNLSYLRLDLHLCQGRWGSDLRRASALTKELGIGLQVAIFVTENAELEIRLLRNELDALKPDVTSFLVFPEKGQRTGKQSVKLAKELLGTYQKGVKIGGGTDMNFFDLNQDPTCIRGLSVVCYSVNPQVHASDVTSLIETLQGQAWTVRSARRFVKDKELSVGPITLRPRFNPDAISPETGEQTGELPSQVDPRQASLFGACWTAGSIKSLAEAGADSLTYYETTGWRGIMETEDGPPLPAKFPSRPGMVFPLYYVLCDISEMSGGSICQTTSTDPMTVDGLTVAKNGRKRMLLFNLTPRRQEVELDWSTHPETMIRHLNENTARDASHNWEGFRSRNNDSGPGKGWRNLILLPYEVLRLDSS